MWISFKFRFRKLYHLTITVSLLCLIVIRSCVYLRAGLCICSCKVVFRVLSFFVLETIRTGAMRGLHVQQSSLRHSSAHVHHKRLSQKNRTHPVTTVSKQPHHVRSPFWCYLCCNRNFVFAQKHDFRKISGNHEITIKQLQSSL